MTDPDTTAECDYCGRPMFPRNPTAKGHLCRRCLHDIQVGDRL
ncbi:CxxC motif protein [Haloferax virus Halfgib1]|nr:CxxC motif protein [Haloferax virus Halfgib1]